MTTSARRKRLLLAGCTWAVVLAAMIGFAAEPTTSTQADAHEGRGVFVVQSGAHQAHVVASAEDLVPGARALALVALLAALLLAGGASVVTAESDRQQSRSVLRWASSARRGPPALV